VNTKNEIKQDVLKRFSNRVENYVKYRPQYPDEIVELLEKENILQTGSVIADIGSGTGFSALPFLKKDYKVIGIEPNEEMRNAGDDYLKDYSKFNSINATAELTTLENNSVELIIAGQAFHWFNIEQARKEFKRILKQDGNILLIWNDRIISGDQFHEVYEDFIKMFAIDYKEVNHKNLDDQSTIQDFFGTENKLTKKVFENSQALDFTGMKGRVLSSSYMPNESHKDHEFMISVMKKIFTRFQENGKITIKYNTTLFYSKLN